MMVESVYAFSDLLNFVRKRRCMAENKNKHIRMCYFCNSVMMVRNNQSSKNKNLLTTSEPVEKYFPKDTYSLMKNYHYFSKSIYDKKKSYDAGLVKDIDIGEVFKNNVYLDLPMLKFHEKGYCKCYKEFVVNKEGKKKRRPFPSFVFRQPKGGTNSAAVEGLYSDLKILKSSFENLKEIFNTTMLQVMKLQSRKIDSDLNFKNRWHMPGDSYRSISQREYSIIEERINFHNEFSKNLGKDLVRLSHQPFI